MGNQTSDEARGRTVRPSSSKSVATAEASSLSALIAENAPVSKWVPHFGNRREAIKHFASVHSSRNRLIGVQQACFLCGGQQADSAASYRWSARFNKSLSFGGLDALLLLFGHLRVRVNNEIFSFNTTHPICSACAKQLKMKRWLATILKIVGVLLVLLFAVFAAVAWGVFFTAARARDRAAGLEGALITTLVFALGVALLYLARVLAVPAPLRYLASRPFFSSSATFTRRR